MGLCFHCRRSLNPTISWDALLIEPLWADDDYGYGEQLVSLRDTTPPRIWSALYQQEPSPDTGDYFKEDWLHPVDILPDRSTMRTYGASDYAVTGDGGDYTVHVVFGLDHLNHLYLLDVWRGQKKADVWIEALCDLVQKYRPLAWAEEGGQIKSGIGPFLDRQMRERRVYVNRTSFPPAATNLSEPDQFRGVWLSTALLP